MLQDDGAALSALLRRDRLLQQVHLAMLTPALPRRRGDIDPDLAVAKAKMAEFDTMDETLAALTAREKRALLSDPQGFQELLDKSK